MYRKKDSNECKEGNVESTFILIFVLSLEIFPEICKDRTTNRLAVLSSLHKSLIFIQNAYCVPPKNNFSKFTKLCVATDQGKLGFSSPKNWQQILHLSDDTWQRFLATWSHPSSWFKVTFLSLLGGFLSKTTCHI